jgi:hypothetical protein
MPRNKPKIFEQLELLIETWNLRLEREGLGIIGRKPNPYQSGCTGHDRITREAKTQYYQSLSSHTARYAFKNPLDSIVMHLVSDGMSLVDVAKELKKHRKSRTPRTIGLIVRRYEKLWGIRRG